MYYLPDLPYEYNALEPFIDEETMKIHHTKHHQAYIDNLNKTLEGSPELKEQSPEELLKNISEVPEKIRQSVINNGGGHANHSFFWKIMSPTKSEPGTKLSAALQKEFGSIDNFKEQFTEKAMTVFGSGWAFLIMTAEKKLGLKRHSFQNSPLMDGNVPLLGIDVWEHAYYLKYRNRKAEYVSNWWNVVNWQEAEKNYTEAFS